MFKLVPLFGISEGPTISTSIGDGPGDEVALILVPVGVRDFLLLNENVGCDEFNVDTIWEEGEIIVNDEGYIDVVGDEEGNIAVGE
jgi:hypothetical protein